MLLMYSPPLYLSFLRVTFDFSAYFAFFCLTFVFRFFFRILFFTLCYRRFTLWYRRFVPLLRFSISSRFPSKCAMKNYNQSIVNQKKKHTGIWPGTFPNVSTYIVGTLWTLYLRCWPMSDLEVCGSSFFCIPGQREYALKTPHLCMYEVPLWDLLIVRVQ